jgi:hypothetical protein
MSLALSLLVFKSWRLFIIDKSHVKVIPYCYRGGVRTVWSATAEYWKYFHKKDIYGNVYILCEEEYI